jgi:hypothetical protein
VIFHQTWHMQCILKVVRRQMAFYCILQKEMYVLAGEPWSSFEILVPCLPICCHTCRFVVRLIIGCLTPSSAKYFMHIRARKSVTNMFLQKTQIQISSSDNKSVSHWIMFDYFFHVWKVNIFFFLIMCLIYSCSHV